MFLFQSGLALMSLILMLVTKNVSNGEPFSIWFIKWDSTTFTAIQPMLSMELRKKCFELHQSNRLFNRPSKKLRSSVKWQ